MSDYASDREERWGEYLTYLPDIEIMLRQNGEGGVGFWLAFFSSSCCAVCSAHEEFMR